MKRNSLRPGPVPKGRQHRYALRQWVDRLKGVPAFIVGTAPSLLEMNVNVGALSDYFTIGINRAFKYLDPTILFWQDMSLWDTEADKVVGLKALKVARDSADPKRQFYNFLLKGPDFKFAKPKQTHVLYGRGASGPLCVQLAYAMGCSPIVLLGIDCQLGADGRTDAYGNNKFWTDKTLDNCTRGLLFIRQTCPVPTRAVGRSTLWPQETIEQILSDIDPDGKYRWGREKYVKQLFGA